MQHKDIQAGQWITLKPDRKEAYAMTDARLLVLSVVPRKGYAVPWIKCRTGSVGEGMFKPSDFRS